MSFLVAYDDGDRLEHDLEEEVWRYASDVSNSPSHAKSRAPPVHQDGIASQGNGIRGLARPNLKVSKMDWPIEKTSAKILPFGKFAKTDALNAKVQEKALAVEKGSDQGGGTVKALEKVDRFSKNAAQAGNYQCLPAKERWKRMFRKGTLAANSKKASSRIGKRPHSTYVPTMVCRPKHVPTPPALVFMDENGLDLAPSTKLRVPRKGINVKLAVSSPTCLQDVHLTAGRDIPPPG